MRSVNIAELKNRLPTLPAIPSHSAPYLDITTDLRDLANLSIS